MKLIKNKAFLKTAFISLLLLIALELSIVFLNAFLIQSEETQLYKKSYNIQSEIEKVFLNIFTISDAYTSYITENPDASREETESFLLHILAHEENYINNIAFVEDTTIIYNYPYQGNQDSIGIDLSEITSQKDDVLYVKNSMKPLLVGPVDLVQGGSGFILRTPIVINGEYFGHIATVINADELIVLLEEQAEKNNIELEIGYPNQDPFISIGSNFSEESVTTSLNNEYFILELSTYNLDDSNLLQMINGLGRLLGLLTIAFFAYYIYKNNRLMLEVQQKATHDSLTKINNRTKFTEDFKNGLITGKLIAYLDINKFKNLNDTLGHHFGDWGLVQIANEFSSNGHFYAYRNSGDEFFLVSKEAMTKEEFLSDENSFCSSFYNEEIKQNIDIVLSVGVIEKVDENIDFEKMLMYLDYAMYDAKKQNRSHTIVNEVLMSKYNEQKHIEQVLINDIINDKFLVYFQPIINLKSKKIDSIETLSRWKYNDKVLSAGKFIDIVKKIKYIERVDRNLFNNLQKHYQIIKEQCGDINEISFNVNLSAEILKEFEHDLSKFDDYIKLLKIPINQIIFEISEDINLGIISDKTLEYIKNKGFNIVIDDFGSGVSKLSDVLSGKLHAIKMDKSMLPIDKNDINRLKGFNTIIKAVNATGSLVCVEGVESKEQLMLSKEAGCAVVQGYLFGSPMTLEEIIKYIQNFDYSQYE